MLIMKTIGILLKVRVLWFLKVKTSRKLLSLTSRKQQVSFQLSGKTKVVFAFPSGALKPSPTGAITAVNAIDVF
jgi:hypothetical protein